MSRYRYRPKIDFTEDYKRLRSRVNREYGEHAYGDKPRIEMASMLKEAEPDYAMPKPKLQTAEQVEKLQPKLEAQEIDKLLEAEMKLQPTDYKLQPMENDLQKMESAMTDPLQPLPWNEPMGVEDRRRARKPERIY